MHKLFSFAALGLLLSLYMSSDSYGAQQNRAEKKAASATKKVSVDNQQFLSDLLSMPILSNPSVSPDGKWVAWTWYHIGPAGDIYLAPTDGSRSPTRMTNAQDDCVISSWTPDSKALLVKQDKDGNERDTLYKLPVDQPGKLEPLTEQKPDYFMRGGQMHPNGKWLVYAANYDFARKREIDETLVWRHDLSTGEKKALARPEKPGEVFPRLSPDGAHVLYERNDLDPAGLQVWLVDIEGKNDREILNFGPNKKVWATWMPDSKNVLFWAEAEKHRKLGRFNIDTGDITWLIDDPKRNIEFARAPLRTNLIVVGEYKNARLVVTLLDPTSGRETRITDGGNPNNSLNVLAPAGDSWIAETYSSQQPSDLVKLSAELNGTSKSISNIWAQTKLKKEQLAQAEDFFWKSSDGMQMHGWLYKTKAVPVKGTIVLVHGGPTAHEEDALDPEVQYLAAEGFNVMCPNYRGSTGYGLAFMDAIKADGWGGKEQDDIRTGIEALIRAGVAQPKKIGVTGTSYGGYSSWQAITRLTPDLVRASAPICGMTDLIVDYNTTRPDLRTYCEEMMGGSPDQVPTKYRERSPINYVSKIKGKLLIVQGAQDPNVTPENVKEVEIALGTASVPYEKLVFEDEGHGIHKLENVKTLYKRLAEFFDKSFQAEDDDPRS